MRSIVTIRFGSHLYGISTPESDNDFKSVYVPDARDVLLQRVRGSVNNRRPKTEKEKNLPGEVEEESYSLQRYLQLVAEGNPQAFDMLFAPEWSMTQVPGGEWLEIQRNRGRLLSRRPASFVSYCKQQANKYGIKGSRVASARAALTLLEALNAIHGTSMRLGDFEGPIAGCIAGHEHMQFVDTRSPSGAVIRHWEVCGKKLPFNSGLKNARDVIQRLVAEYGQRALQAENQRGVDWKALSHAVRVGQEALELLRTGHITFPLTTAAAILAIKKGQLPYQQVATVIEQLLEEVEQAAQTSSLPDEPDLQWIDDFVCRVYGDEVYSDYEPSGRVAEKYRRELDG